MQPAPTLTRIDPPLPFPNHQPATAPRRRSLLRRFLSSSSTDLSRPFDLRPHRINQLAGAGWGTDRRRLTESRKPVAKTSRISLTRHTERFGDLFPGLGLAHKVLVIVVRPVVYHWVQLDSLDEIEIKLLLKIGIQLVHLNGRREGMH